MTVDVTTDKEFLINTLVHNLKWSYNALNSFKLEELIKLYTYVKDGYLICKAKTSSRDHVTSITIPKRICVELGLTYGDRFNVKVNVKNREVVLEPSIKGKLKLGKANKIVLPVVISAKKLLKDNDDTMVMLKDDRIILKSFSYMQ